MTPYAAKLHDGKAITIICEGRQVNGVQNMLAIWVDQWRGNTLLTLREVYPAGGQWYAGSQGYNIPIECVDLVLTQTQLIYQSYVKAVTKSPAKRKARA